MMGIFDEIEIEIFEQTGSLDDAQAVGHAAREAMMEVIDTLAYLLGLGPCFSAEVGARLQL